MHIAILNGIISSESQVNWGNSPIDTYIKFLNSSGKNFSCSGFELSAGEFPSSSDNFDAFLITGSPRGVYDSDPWINELKQFIRDRFKLGDKFVGICFGHQILAHALGGFAEKSEKGWGFGQKQITISKKKTWMGDQPDQINLYYVHQDQVTSLPANAENLGGSDFVPNALFTIDNQVLGIQGHPEFTKDIMVQIASSHKEDFDPKFYDLALQSINNGSPDNQLLAIWIADFLTN